MKDIPENERDKEICLVALESNAIMAFGHIPKNIRDKEIYLIAVQQDGRLLKHVPYEIKDEEICLMAVQNNVKAIEYVPAEEKYRSLFLDKVSFLPALLHFVPKSMRDKKICLLAVQKIGKLLQEVPDEIKDEEICAAAVRKDKMALKYVPAEKKYRGLFLAAVERWPETLQYIPDSIKTEAFCLKEVQKKIETLNFIPTNMRTHVFYLKVVTENKKALKYIPADMRNEDICLAAVRADGRALQYVPENLRNEALCLAAVQADEKALKHVPKNLKNQNLCLTAVQAYGSALKYVPENLRNENLCLAAVQVDGMALQYVSENLRNENLCFAAVQQNGSAIRFISDEDIKNIIIQRVTPEKILHDDYGNIKYFPPDYKEHYAFLLGIKHVVISHEDKEVEDFYLVYSDAEQRRGKTLRTSKKNAEMLLKDLKAQNATHLNLVLLGHATRKSESLADLNPGEVVAFLKQYSNIDRVTLLGCNTAHAQKLESEKAKTARFAESHQDQTGIGLFTMSNMPTKEQLGKKSQEEGYIIVKEENEYKLIYFKKVSDKIEQVEFSTSEEKLKVLHTQIKGKTGMFSFPRAKTMWNEINNNLTSDQLESVLNTKFVEERFSKKHPERHLDKEIYPFLTSAEFDVRNKEEEGKLQDSLLKKMIDAIQGDTAALGRDILVKGYTKKMHVDTKERRFHATRTHLYKSGNYRQGFFQAREDNINRKKLAQERKGSIKEMKEGEHQDGDTMHKSIKVTIRK